MGLPLGGAVPIFISSYVLLASFVVYLEPRDTLKPVHSDFKKTIPNFLNPRVAELVEARKKSCDRLLVLGRLKNLREGQGCPKCKTVQAIVASGLAAWAAWEIRKASTVELP